MKPEQFIDLLDSEAKRHLDHDGVEIGDSIAWGYVKNLIESYRKKNGASHA
jgi:hypothetical protein